MCSVSVNRLVKQFTTCLGVVVTLLLNIMERGWSCSTGQTSKECVCCACDIVVVDSHLHRCLEVSLHTLK